MAAEVTRVEIRDGREFVVTVLKRDWRLKPSAARRRASGADLVKPCPSCGRRVIAWKDAKASAGKAVCGECRWRRRKGGDANGDLTR